MNKFILISDIIFAFLCVFPDGCWATGGYGLLEARSSDQTGMSSTLSVCILYNDEHQNLPTDIDSVEFHHLVDLSFVEGCTDQDFSNLTTPLINSTVAVMRGTCTFIQKAQEVQSAHGTAVLVVDYKNSTRATYPGGNASEFLSLNITLATIDYVDYIKVLNFSESVQVALYAPTSSHWDANMILMIFLSTLLVVTGSVWSACEERQSPKGSRRRPSKPHAAEEDKDQSDGEPEEPEEISVWGILIWYALICGMILLLYFFYDYMVYFFIALFCVLGSYSLYKCLMPLWSRIMPINYGIPANRLPCIHSKVKLRNFLLIMPCLTIGIFWAIERHAAYAWALQDLLGASFCIFFIHTLRLPNLKVISVLLILLLVYDVFFVFITPFFTSDGSSIMESVATGGRGHSKESLPMVFLLPTLTNSQISKCTDHRFSMLGFGDVIIPGLLVSYNAIFDVKTGTRMVYFLCSSIGYLFGMIVCMISLVYMNSGQPALLYLVPGTLFTTIVVATARKELRTLYFGQHKQLPKGDNKSECKDTNNEEGDINNDGVGEEERNLIH